jgi:signal transduction histidine kinase
MTNSCEDRLRVVIDFSAAITASTSLHEHELLHLIHEHVSRLMDTNNMSIVLYDAIAREVRFGLVFVGGREIDLQTDRRWSPRRNGEGRFEHIIHTKRYLLHSTKQEFDDWQRQPGQEKYGDNMYSSWLGVPIRIGERILGVIAIYHLTQEHTYNIEDVEMLQMLANYAAGALINVNLTSDQVANRQLATLGTAMAVLQHRINNSFNIITPNVMRLRKRVDLNDATTVEILDIIDRNARLTSELIRRIMEPLKASEDQEVDLQGVINDVAQEKYEEWEKDQADRPIQVVPELAGALPLFRAPIGQIAEVFRNCLDNAYRAMPTGGKIVIKTSLTDGIIEARIADTGTGIAPAIRERLFHKPVPPKEQGGGAGLGLWLNRMILQGIGGDIQIESTGEQGTTVLVQIPVRRT